VRSPLTTFRPQAKYYRAVNKLSLNGETWEDFGPPFLRFAQVLSKACSKVANVRYSRRDSLAQKVEIMPKISICIPAYDMGGKGAMFLEQSFLRLGAQDFDDFEVVVSDQSQSSDVYDLCVSTTEITVRHVWFRDGPKQASANTNNAMRHATGEIIKVLFQDDLLMARDALRQTAEAFDHSDAAWLICGSGVTRDGQTVERPMVPRLHPQLHLGKNTVSSPSVLAMRAAQKLEFDEDLIWLMDVDLYKRLLLAYGAPHILPDTLVWNRLHSGQVSESVSGETRARELKYVRGKFSAHETFGDWLMYHKQVLKIR
jgi:glycosyltransferase involved in cell wall biosynthesis